MMLESQETCNSTRWCSSCHK